MTILAAGLLLSACGKENASNTTPAPVETKPEAAVMEYSLTVGDDLLDACELTIEYYDVNGVVQTQQMLKPSWNESVRAKLPTSLGVRLTAKMKGGNVDGGSKTEDLTITAEYSYKYKGYAVDSYDKILGEVVANNNQYRLDMKTSDIPGWLEKRNGILVQFLSNFDADGKVTEGSWQ